MEARASLIAAGIGRAAIDAVVARATDLLRGRDHAVVVDLGSGSGETLGALASVSSSGCSIGIDLSTAAATHAARRFPGVTWVVANADRRLPLLDASVTLVLSVHGRRNPAECHRVLTTDGHLLVAIPGADDLIELREQVQGDAVARDRTPALIEEHAACFDVIDRTAVRQQHALEGEALHNLLRGTYRGERFSASSRVQQLERLTVTLASDLVLFRPRA